MDAISRNKLMDKFILGHWVIKFNPRFFTVFYKNSYFKQIDQVNRKKNSMVQRVPCFFSVFSVYGFVESKKAVYLHPLSENGTIAQLVEQRTENPCVPGSIPGGTTANKDSYMKM